MPTPIPLELYSAITTLMQQRAAALVQCDLAYLESLLAADFRYINASGQLLDRSAYLERLATGALRFSAQSFEQLEIAAYGDVFIVTCLLHDQAAWQGQSFEANFRALHVYQQQPDGWRWLAGQATEA